MPRNQKIVVGMSGGIDSCIALVLLKKQGWQPLGVSLKFTTGGSFEDAKKVCKKLGVPHFIVDASKDFKSEVIDYFISELKRKRTPNPCVICNWKVKFKKLFEFARKQSVKYIATGHYAKIKDYYLLRPKDREKDQTYVLCFLPQKWLKHIVFPLGEYTKDEVCQMAKKEGFDFLLKRKQSQDFCFAIGRPFSCFLEKKLGKKQGIIMDTENNILGKHQGLHFYTIGQRKGIKLSGGPYFVKGFNLSKNILIVTKNQKEIFQKELVLSPFHFISGEAPKKKIEVLAKVRYRQPLSRAVLCPAQRRRLRIIFKKRQRAVTPGQFCVFYKNNICLGGGVIV